VIRSVKAAELGSLDTAATVGRRDRGGGDRRADPFSLGDRRSGQSVPAHIDWHRGEVVVHDKMSRQDRLRLRVDVGEAMEAFARRDSPASGRSTSFTMKAAVPRRLGGRTLLTGQGEVRREHDPLAVHSSRAIVGSATGAGNGVSGQPRTEIRWTRAPCEVNRRQQRAEESSGALAGLCREVCTSDGQATAVPPQVAGHCR
jgi:hypothetical protein